MSDLDPFADEDPWAGERAARREPQPGDQSDDELDDWARTRAQPTIGVPHELRARIARQQAAPALTGRVGTPTGAAPGGPVPGGGTLAPPMPAPPVAPSAPSARPLPTIDPRRARHRSIRSAGPFVALVLPLLAAGLTALMWKVVSCDGSGCALPGAVGWASGAMAAPTAPVAGIPWQTSVPAIAAAGASSLVVWFAVGTWAARRATIGPEATWGGFVRQLLRLAIGMWLGVLAGLGAMVVVLLQT